MFSAELSARARRFEKNSAVDAEKLKRKKEKERLLKERAEARQKKLEEALEARKRAEREAAERAEQERDATREANRGVFVSEVLTGTILDESSVAARGIKRATDKMILPREMGDVLMAQDAPKNGAMLFEVESMVTGRVTHAGVLEFTAPSRTVSLPRKVLRCLFGDGGADALVGDVRVTYKRLEKGVHVALQPRAAAFHTDVGDVAESVLEDALMRCCALTEGDVIEVGSGEAAYELTVRELQPEHAVCVIDTEMSAHIVSSEETDAAIAAAEAEQRRIAEQLERERERQLRAAAEAEAAAEAARKVRREEAAAASAAAEAERARAEAALPPEPSADCGEPCAVCMVRLPNGTRATRRVRHAAPLTELFTWVDSLPRSTPSDDAASPADPPASKLWSPGTYALVTQFPRRTFQPNAAGTLVEAGLTSPQESFLLEALAKDGE